MEVTLLAAVAGLVRWDLLRQTMGLVVRLEAGEQGRYLASQVAAFFTQAVAVAETTATLLAVLVVEAVEGMEE